MYKVDTIVLALLSIADLDFYFYLLKYFTNVWLKVQRFGEGSVSTVLLTVCVGFS